MRNEDDGLAVEALEGFDKLLEHRVRLAICALLSRHDSMSFRRFKDLLEETDGNLGANLRRLEDGGYVEVTKEFVDRKPVSLYRLTPGGREALHRHVESLSGLIDQIR